MSISGTTRPGRGDFADERRGGFFQAQMAILSGLALMAAAALAVAALATWNVDDPSLSNANGNLPLNAGGYAGAAFADLMMQFLGLASVLAIAPLASWGWLRFCRLPIGNLRGRAVSWILAVLAGATAFACLPSGESWPLPTGLGGVSGDLVLRLPQLLSIGLLVSVPVFVVSAIAALILSLHACAVIGRRQATSEQADDNSGDVVRIDANDEDDDSPGLVLGALAHGWYSLRARLRRKPQAASRGKSSHTADPGDRQDGLRLAMARAWTQLVAPPEDDLDLPEPPQGRGRSEPTLDERRQTAPGFAADDDQEGDWLRAPPAAPEYGERIYEDDPAADWEEMPPPRPQQPVARQEVEAQPSGRVQKSRSTLEPGKRVVREAQTSMFADSFELPALGFLSEPKAIARDSTLSADALEQNARLLEGVLEDFGVRGEIINVHPGPVVTLYELEPAPGIKSSRVIGLADDIARSMSAVAARVAVVPGRNAIGIELPNARRETVYLRELLASREYEGSKGNLNLVLGKTIGGEPVIADLAKMPHLLVAGTTGSGKSVAINTMILSILYRLTPERAKLIMIDPKMLELSIYDGIPHLLTPVVTDPKKAVVALKWTVREMEERYKKMSKLGVRNIDGFNSRVEQAQKKGETITRTIQTGFDRHSGEAIYETEELDLEPMPYIVVVIDEMADLMMVAGKDIEGAIQRLAQMARAAGIHVIMATQRPSVDVITGTIKANFPTRISFQVTSKIDSRTILGEQGAEQLLGMGDMLYMAGGGRILRVHGPFVSDEEVEKVVAHLKTQGAPQYLESVTEEVDDGEDGPVSGGAGGDAGGLGESNDVYDQAVAVVLRDRKVSTSYIQRRLGIGYNRAASLIERMEKEGLISEPNHSGKREILVPGEDETI
jgi:S-DNA-T family DNA segregation ATPase FtsK/SpoIIIE